MFKKPEVLGNEEIIYRKGANFIVTSETARLDRFWADQIMWLIDMEGKEAIGGHLYITNFRIIFVAHSFNRLIGEFSIPLWQVDNAYQKFKFPVNKLIIETDNGIFEFVKWSTNKAIKLIEENNNNILPQF